MLRFFQFLRRIQYPLLFVILELLALRYFTDSSSYTQAKMAMVSNALVGDIEEKITSFNHFFRLKTENNALNEQIVVLNNQIELLKEYALQDNIVTPTNLDSTLQQYTYISAKICRNGVTDQKNYITINKGSLQGIEPDMAIVSAGAIVGYVTRCSKNFAVGTSILNIDFKTSGRLKKNENFGSISWDGISPEYVDLTDVSKYSEMEVGDTILTTSYSSIFPPDLMIGVVESFEIENLTNYHAKIKLAANMRALRNVLIVKNRDVLERKELEEEPEI